MRRCFILHPSSFILLFALTAFAQMPYDVGDWTSYRDFRYAVSVDAGSHEVFVATSGGILEYQLFRQRWYDPIVVGYGMSEAIPLDNPLLLLFDEQTGYVWVATKTQLLQYDVNAERWTVAGRNLWGINDRVVNIGVGANDLYVETVPGPLFANSFLPGSAIPTNNWMGYVTRYKGSRTSGGLMLDLGQTLPEGTRWRGLRSKTPLTPEQLSNNLGSGAANFPTMLLPSGWIWNSDGTVLDPYLRSARLTDWTTDNFGHLWMTYWGAGVLLDDLRGGRPEFYQAGPAGNDVRTILVQKDDVWLAGLNAGDRKGIARASTNLKEWQVYESRDNSRIRSTNTFDMAAWDGDMWFATDDGLLAFRDKDKSWRLYGVNQHLQSDQVTALAAADSELWIGTADGLSVMTRASRDVFRINNRGPLLTNITRLALCGDTLYVGTGLGLYKGCTKDRSFAFAGVDPTITSAAVTDLSVIQTEVWIATTGGVLAYDQSTGKSKSYQLSWLGGNPPTAIYAASSFVWVGTQAGLYRYRRSNNEWISYTTADGLVDNRILALRGDGDDLLIGTANGLTRFYWNRPNRAR
ncbi:MAG TPA: hypothetical protein VGL38_07010 [bacterium]|jgi:hypothetical protein